MKAAALACLGLVPLPPEAKAFSIDRSGNHLRISGVIGEESPAVFNRNLVDAMLELALAGDSSSAIHLYLDLPRGGKAAPAFRVVQLIRTAQAHNTRVVAHVEREATCMSGCTFLFLAANERWIAPEGRLVFHGFSQQEPSKPVNVPETFSDTYYSLLKSANEPFYRFFKASRIIEDDRKVGFTGRRLYGEKIFSGLITGLD